MDDFDKWNSLKKKIELGTNNFIPRVGEVCLCSLGKNIGFESNGKNSDFIRPVLVIKSYKKAGAIILPLTSKKKNNIFHFKISNTGYVKLTQVRFVDLKRFKRRLFRIDRRLLKIIRENLIRVI